MVAESFPVDGRHVLLLAPHLLLVLGEEPVELVEISVEVGFRRRWVPDARQQAEARSSPAVGVVPSPVVHRRVEPVAVRVGSDVAENVNDVTRINYEKRPCPEVFHFFGTGSMATIKDVTVI